MGIVGVLIFQLICCDFVTKDINGNKIKFDYIEDNSLLEDQKLDKLLEEYSSSAEGTFDVVEDQETSMMENQKQYFI